MNSKNKNKKKNSKNGNNTQSILKHSTLNVNATEFVPSTVAQRQEERTNSVTFTTAEQMEDFNVSSSETNDNAMSYTHMDFPLTQMQNYNFGVSEADLFRTSELQQEYPPLFYLPDYMDPMQNYFMGDSLVGPMQNFNINSPETSFNESMMMRQEHPHIGYSAMGQMQNYNIDRYESNDHASSMMHWHRSAPIAYPETDLFFNNEFEQRYGLACDTAFPLCNEWNCQSEFINKIFTNAINPTIPCRSVDNNFGDTTNLSSGSLTELSDFASFPEKKDLNEAFLVTHEDNNNKMEINKYGENIADELAAMLEDDRIDIAGQALIKPEPLAVPEDNRIGEKAKLLIEKAEHTAMLEDDRIEKAGQALIKPKPLPVPKEKRNKKKAKLLKKKTEHAAMLENIRIKEEAQLVMIPETAAMPEAKLEEEAQRLVNPKSKKKKIKSRIENVCSQKEHVNIVFIGHVDAGKSTLGGQMMYLGGKIDKRTLNKFKDDAKLISRDTWFLSWILDTNQEERDKGKTVETGRGHFETKTKHFTILDAPGHKTFVPSMIGGAAQADIAVLVLSARQNEFESGFDKGGQTRDHAVLARSAGIHVIIAVINKMDDPTVNWNENRYNYCRNKTMPFLKRLGYAQKDIHFLPISALTGEGVMSAIPKKTCPWFNGPSFIECLNQLSPIARLIDRPFVMPIAEKFKDMGTVVLGKIEAGGTHISNSLLLMPNKVIVSVEQIWSDKKPVTSAKAGESVKLRLKGIEDEEISVGFVLCDIAKPITTATLFDAHLHIMDCKYIITPGFSTVMHFQSVIEDVTVTHLLCLVDPKTNVKTRVNKVNFVKKHDDAIMRIKCSGAICLTVFKDFPQLGRFTLRDDSQVIAIGKVLKIIKN